MSAQHDLLTAGELIALRLSAELANACRSIMGGHDWNECAAHIHSIQHALMAQAAARAYPGEFRLLEDNT